MNSSIWCLIFVVSLVAAAAPNSGSDATDAPPSATVSSPQGQEVVNSAQEESGNFQTALNAEVWKYVKNQLTAEYDLPTRLTQLKTLRESQEMMKRDVTDLNSRLAQYKSTQVEEDAELNRHLARDTDALREIYPTVGKLGKIWDLKNAEVPSLPQIPDKAEPASANAENDPTAAAAAAGPNSGPASTDASPAGPSPSQDTGSDAPGDVSQAPGAEGNGSDSPSTGTPQGPSNGSPPADPDATAENSIAVTNEDQRAEAALRRIEEEGQLALKGGPKRTPSVKSVDATPSIQGVNTKEDLKVDSALSAFAAKETSVKSSNEYEVASEAGTCEASYWTYFALMMSFNAGGFAMWVYNKYSMDGMKAPLL